MRKTLSTLTAFPGADHAILCKRVKYTFGEAPMGVASISPQVLPYVKWSERRIKFLLFFVEDANILRRKCAPIFAAFGSR